MGSLSQARWHRGACHALRGVDDRAPVETAVGGSRAVGGVLLDAPVRPRAAPCEEHEPLPLTERPYDPLAAGVETGEHRRGVVELRSAVADHELRRRVVAAVLNLLEGADVAPG